MLAQVREENLSIDVVFSVQVSGFRVCTDLQVENMKMVTEVTGEAFCLAVFSALELHREHLYTITFAFMLMLGELKRPTPSLHDLEQLFAVLFIRQHEGDVKILPRLLISALRVRVPSPSFGIQGFGRGAAEFAGQFFQSPSLCPSQRTDGLGIPKAELLATRKTEKCQA